MNKQTDQRVKSSAVNKPKKSQQLYSKISSAVTRTTGSPVVSIIAFLIIVIWAVLGPVFHYSDTWQLVINTGTTIITFLMVFIIQQSQNRDTSAIQLKLNELIACEERASNRLIDVEDLTEQELQVLKKFYVKLSKQAENDNDLHSSHSLDEAEDNQQRKSRVGKKQPTG
jgi:low affinity Fe/Cu permease